jgi:hypothetical protein
VCHTAASMHDQASSCCSSAHSGPGHARPKHPIQWLFQH